MIFSSAAIVKMKKLLEKRIQLIVIPVETEIPSFQGVSKAAFPPRGNRLRADAGIEARLTGPSPEATAE
jgi:hypothetical protein